MNNSLNSGWNESSYIPLWDGVFDDSLSDYELQELEKLQRSCEDSSDSEGW